MKRTGNHKRGKVPSSDLTALLKPYASGWVALTPDEQTVVASAPSIEEAYEEAVKKGCAHPVLLQVFPPDRGIIGVPS